MTDEQSRMIFDNQGNPIMEIDEEIEREEKIIRDEDENRLREATAIQVYPGFLQMCATGKKKLLTGKIEGIDIDLVRAATMAWQAAEALAGVGKISDRGRAYAPGDPIVPERKGDVQ